MSIKLSEAFGQQQSNLWFKMQNSYDFWQAEHSKERKKIVPWKSRSVAAKHEGILV